MKCQFAGRLHSALPLSRWYSACVPYFTAGPFAIPVSTGTANKKTENELYVSLRLRKQLMVHLSQTSRNCKTLLIDAYYNYQVRI